MKVTKSFGAMLPTHGTDQSASPAKQQVLERNQDAQNKEKEEEDKELSGGGKSGRDESQKDVINESGDTQDKEEPENHSFTNSTLEISHNKDSSNGESQNVDDNNDEKDFNLNTESNTPMQILDSELQRQKSEHEQHNNSKAIIQTYSTGQNEESLVVMVNIDSPNRILHDIITHKLGDTNLEDLEEVKDRMDIG
ncbi:hypothetical protein RDI58_000857 [Solanum bulbocastanum]|uniref:Uncharacterized protein n=1 Tax=Solanum bulbocastanum TaxID=147425 RepID=A0AAN8U8B7_SOLBU